MIMVRKTWRFNDGIIIINIINGIVTFIPLFFTRVDLQTVLFELLFE